jgi:hypothetical protein
VIARSVLIALVAALYAVTVGLAADSTDPRITIATADQAYAARILLRFNDLGPAWSGGAHKPTSLKIPVCPSNQPNNSDLTITGHAESGLNLQSAAIQVDTDVLVFQTKSQVAKLVKRIFLAPALGDCLRYDLIKSVGGQGVTVVGVSQLPVKKAGDHSQLFRVTLSVASNGKKVPVYSDFLYVSQGRAQYFVNIVSPGAMKTELPSLENGIAKRLAAKAKSQASA